MYICIETGLEPEAELASCPSFHRVLSLGGNSDAKAWLVQNYRFKGYHFAIPGEEFYLV